MKTKAKKWLIALLVIMLLALLMLIPAVGDKVAAMVGTTGEAVAIYAQTAFFISLGVFLISSGAAAMAVPFIGGALIIIGLIMVAVSVYRMYQYHKPTNKIG